MIKKGQSSEAKQIQTFVERLSEKQLKNASKKLSQLDTSSLSTKNKNIVNFLKLEVELGLIKSGIEGGGSGPLTPLV